MTTERDCIYEVQTEVSLFNENNILKPYGYQMLFEQIAEQHLNRYHLNVDETMKYGYAWALISLEIEQINPVPPCETIYARTWHSQYKRPYFRREMEFRNTAGDLLFHGSSFSVLLEIEKRTIYRKKESPFTSPAPEELFTIEASPTFKNHLSFENIEERKVYHSYIDPLGHVNNCRYGEFAYDAFSKEEKKRLSEMKRMEIYFISELRPDDTFTIGKAYEDNKLFIRGHNNIKNDNAFDIVMCF
ncbi:acyl-ACP thioesterase domain-containing protein [Anaerovorax sp. IOR16]|uniref:acyl-ACP thioesterase domain-containing protein n=1 Tax=Anaerovorax sp. IOR16 TaxID=2773458 RepID=UPI0019D21409|nr:acyl-ACP thioesterase domain-containing protein [Anaerovorax sp. IOR16]